MIRTNTWFRLDRHDEPPADPAPAGEPPADPKPQFDGDFDPARAAKLIENLRGDLVKAKQTAAEASAGQKAAAEQALAELTSKLGKVLGYEADETPDVGALTTQIEEARNAAWVAGVELGVYRLAGELGADAEALLDSNFFRDKLDDLFDVDPRSPQFAEGVRKAVQEAVDARPGKYKLADPGPRVPRPDPGQGGRPDAPVNFATADKATFAAEAAKYRIRPRTF